MSSWQSDTRKRNAIIGLLGGSLTALILWWWWQRKVEDDEENPLYLTKTLTLREQQLMTVFVGPSGVGKGTILSKVRKEFGSQISVAVSHTTRLAREGEIDGVHYHFVSQGKFEEMVSNGEFIENKTFASNSYGTSSKAVEDIAAKNQVCFLEIDIHGAIALKKRCFLCRFVFIKTSGDTLEMLRQRLDGRGTESEAQIDLRLQSAEKELDFLSKNPDFFDLVLNNDDIDDATKELCDKLSEWYKLKPEDADWNMIDKDLNV